MNALLFGYWSVVRKEILHLLRDRTTFVIALMIPIVQLTIFGFAADFDVRHIPTVIVDYDHSPESRNYLQGLVNTQYIDIIGSVDTPADALSAIRRGSAKAAIIIPPDFSRHRRAGKPADVQILLDGSDSQVALRARQAVAQPGISGPISPHVDTLFNPRMRTQVFMVPGLIAVILQLVTVSLTAFSLVREREQGTLEQMMVSPIGRLGLMLGKLTPYAVLALLETAAVLLVGWLIFDVQVVGSVALLMLLSVPFIVAALSLGLLISTISENQGQALQFTMLVTLPSILMSGFVFPRDTMPGVLYLVSNAIPVTYFLEIIRGVVVRGAGFGDLWPNVWPLLLISTLLLAISTSRFRKAAA